MIGAHYSDSSDPAVLKRAKGWLQSAVLGHDVDAAYLLALIYERDIADVGTPAKAAELYEAMIADYNDVRARRRLALLLLDGKGVEADTARAETLLVKRRFQWRCGVAVDARRSSAGGCGCGRPSTGDLAWLRKAAAAGDADARVSLARSALVRACRHYPIVERRANSGRR